MLDNHNGSSEKDILSKLKEKLSGKEPVEPTEPHNEDPSEGEPLESEEETEASEIVEESDEPEEGGDLLEEESEGDEEELYAVTVDGEELEVNFEELKAGYQKEKSFRQNSMALADEKKAFQSQKQEYEKLFNDKVAELEAAIKDNDSAIDWADLRDNDPSEYLRQKEVLKEKESALSSSKELSQKQFDEKAQQEAQKLIDAMPEWKDVAKREADTKLALDYASRVGFTNKELNSQADHRFYLMMLNAAKFEQLQKSKPAVKKKVSKAPKGTRPGKAKSVSKKTDYQERIAKLRKSGSDKDAFAAIRAKL